MAIKKIIGVSEYLVDHLRTEIINGSLKPGEKIKEYQLSESLEVSRPILREVLRTLESERLVNIIPRKGSYVSTISLEDFIELYEIREMIECKAIDLIKSKKIRALPQIDQAIKKASTLRVPSLRASVSDFYSFFETGLSFHLILVNATGNRRLSQIYQGIRHNLLRYHVILSRENLAAQVKVDHSDIAKRLANGQYVEAKKILQAHIRCHAEIIKRNIEHYNKNHLSARIKPT